MKTCYKEVTVSAPAKVNICLHVKGKRQDGYHDIVSVMQALKLSDEVTVSALEGAGGRIDVLCDHPAVPLGERNIAFRAARTFLDHAKIDAGVRIVIGKHVPVAAGLGGGSSDAAAVLKGLSILFGQNIDSARLREMGLSLGADVPFFLSWPTALAEGVGEVLSELPPPEETWLVLVNPGFEVPTAWVYSNLKIGLTNMPNSITLPPFKGQALSAGLLVSYLHNDLERVTAGKYPQISLIKERLSDEGALGALMSGSGPTVFGIFKDRKASEMAARQLRRPGWTVVATRTISDWPEPLAVTL